MKSIYIRRIRNGNHSTRCRVRICCQTETAAFRDSSFMREALSQASIAALASEVPVGAVLVVEREDGTYSIVSRAHNQTERAGSPLAHAEMLAIEQGSGQLGAWRLMDCTLYVTLEPCPMCAGAILNSRLKRVVYGARQPRVGADGSWISLLRRGKPSPEESGPSDDQELDSTPHPFHPNLEVTPGILEKECSQLLIEFFRRRRKESQRQTVKIYPGPE